MHNQKKVNIITLSEYQVFEKNEIAVTEKAGHIHRDKDMDFIETLFRFLGEKRETVISFIRMKLDRQHRAFFSVELENCNTLRQQARCIKKYIGHLKVNDARAILLSLPDMMPGKIEALTYHGENMPESRLMKFAQNFRLSDGDALFCMLFFLMTREIHGTVDALGVGRAV